MTSKLLCALPLVIAVVGTACLDGARLSELVTAPDATLLFERQRLSPSAGNAATDAVFAGNAQTIAAAPALVPPGTPLAPFIEARLYAIANVAMHDAAHDAIVGAPPNAQASTHAWYANEIALLSGPGMSAGISVGRRVAAAVLTLRANDGVAGGGVGPYTAGTNVGDSTPRAWTPSTTIISGGR